MVSMIMLKVTKTSDRIDLEKLKQREKIMFYDDIVLFEDELADNGASVLNIKIVSRIIEIHDDSASTCFRFHLLYTQKY